MKLNYDKAITIQAKLAVASRKDHRGQPAEVVSGLRRDFVAAKLAEHMEKVMRDVEPFTREQNERFLRILGLAE